MNNKYQEHEIKVLGVNVESVCQKLEKMGAEKVFEGDRVFTTFDNKANYYRKSKTTIRLTEEDKLKLSISDIKKGLKDTVKLFVSRKQETIDLFRKLGIFPVAEVKSHRISYEFEGVDFDIDVFPKIPPFLEIDLENVKDLTDLLSKLGLEKNETFFGGTEDIYSKYGMNYFKEFAIGDYPRRG